jgi:hypothetical protein
VNAGRTKGWEATIDAQAEKNTTTLTLSLP